MKILERVGECSMCGNCCRYLRFEFGTGKVTKRAREFFKARGIKVRTSKYTGKMFLLVPNDCPHLKGDLCDLHPKKPKDCRVQPIAPWSHEGFKCSYKWIKKEAIESTKD